jgi:tRNA threonylcarbamoyladenosine biosynthesis protein TsaE
MSSNLLLINGLKNKKVVRHCSESADETIEIAYRLGKNLETNSVLCFFGDLGAGKTTFIKGLVKGINEAETEISSPTFVYLNIYPGSKTVYHFDLYRLRDADEFLSMGFDEFLTAGGICCIEWSERIRDLLPAHCVQISLEHVSENSRTITILMT